jgi:hypothetical protein
MGNVIRVGTTYTTTTVWLDANSNPVDTSPLTCTIYDGNGQVVQSLPAPTHDSTGHYHLDVYCSVPGFWKAVWNSPANGTVPGDDIWIWYVEPN